MSCFRILTYISLFWLLCEKSEQMLNETSLETRVKLLETQVLLQSINNVQHVNKLESLIKTVTEAGKRYSGGGIAAGMENRLDIMEKHLHDKQNRLDDVEERLLDMEKRLKSCTIGLSLEKVKARKVSDELVTFLEKQREDFVELQEKFDLFLDEYNTRMFDMNTQFHEAVEKLNNTLFAIQKDIAGKEKSVPTARVTCPAGWFELMDHCYYYEQTMKTDWLSANRNCHFRDAKLAEPKTQELMVKLLEKVGENVWIGGTDVETEGVWLWSETEELITYHIWEVNQPNSYDGNQDCLEILREGWNDEDCSDRQKYLCEKLR